MNKVEDITLWRIKKLDIEIKQYIQAIQDAKEALDAIDKEENDLLSEYSGEP